MVSQTATCQHDMTWCGKLGALPLDEETKTFLMLTRTNCALDKLHVTSKDTMFRKVSEAVSKENSICYSERRINDNHTFVFVSFFQVYIRQHKKDHSHLTPPQKEAPSPSNVENSTR